MKTLILMRHAEAETNSAGGTDFDRVLSARGRKEAKESALELRDAGFVPSSILSSAAPRALQTARRLARCMDFDKKKIRVQPELYLPDCDTLLNAIMQTNDDVECIAVVCHNPATSDLASILSFENGVSLRTAGYVVLQFQVDSWNALRNGKIILRS